MVDRQNEGGVQGHCVLCVCTSVACVCDGSVGVWMCEYVYVCVEVCVSVCVGLYVRMRNVSVVSVC